MKNIKAITFDLDGVYFVNGKSNFIANLEKHGVSKDEAVRVFFKSEEMNKAYKEGKMTDDEFWTFAIKEWRLYLSVSEIIDLLISGYEVNESVVKVVKSLRKKGYKTCICSNNFPARINGLQKRFGFLDNFDAISLSYKIGATKPSSEIFKKLVLEAKVRPEEIVFTDDNEYNLEEARKIGINAFFYEGFDKFMNSLKDLGVDC